MEKKNVYDCRLALGFSPSDPEQVRVVNFLKTLGRKKSFFITKAVIYYLENCPNPEIPGMSAGNVPMATESMIRKVLSDMLASGEINGQLLGIQPQQAVEKKEPLNKNLAEQLLGDVEPKVKAEKQASEKKPSYPKEKIFEKKEEIPISEPEVNTELPEEVSMGDAVDMLNALSVFGL